MTTLAGSAITLADWKQSLTPDQKAIDAIIEMMLVQSGLLTDMPIKEGNLTTGHRSTIRTGLPTVTWRKFNQSVQPSKGSKVQVDDTCGMAEAFMEVDSELAKLGGLTSAFLAEEAQAHIIAFKNDVTSKIIYGDSSLTPEEPLGLAPRYPGLGDPNVITFGGTGSDLTSLWFATWGDQTGFGIVPKGSTVGLEHKDLGEQLITSSDGHIMKYVQNFKWKIGLCVKDWRYFVRCCNIESAGLTGTGTNNLIDKLPLLIQAKNLIPDESMGRTVIYCNRDVKTQFDVAAYNKTSPSIYATETGGKHQTMFMGIPIVRCDAILSTESALT